MKQDVTLLVCCYTGAFVVYHLIAVLFWLIERRKSMSDFYEAYFSDKVLMTGLLFSCWFLGYNAVSYAIWAQFESRLERDAPPDDFEFVAAGEAFDNGFGGSEAGLDGAKDGSRMACQTLLVTMPSGDLVIGTNTRSQSGESLLMLGKAPRADIEQADKTVELKGGDENV